KVRGARVWRSRNLSSRDVTNRGGLRLTNLARTMIDLSWVLDDGWLRACFDSAVRQNRTIVSWLWRALSSHGPGRRGIGRLRALLQGDRRTDAVPDNTPTSLPLTTTSTPRPQHHLHPNLLNL